MPQNFSGVMREFQKKNLHSGSSTGKVVSNPKQAKAIAISEQQKMNDGDGDEPKARLKKAIRGLK